MKNVLILLIILLISSCSNFEKNIATDKLHINLELMVIPKNSQNKREGYALLGKINNSLKRNIAFPNQVFQIDYQNNNGKWEKVYTDVYFIGMYDKGLHPYELDEMNSFRKYNSRDTLIKDIIKKKDFPINDYNLNQVGISSIYYSLLKKDSTMLFSRSIDDYLDYSSDFFKENIKKGYYRFFFRNRDNSNTLKLKNKNGKIEEINVPKSIGVFDMINQTDIVSDTLFLRIW